MDGYEKHVDEILDAVGKEVDRKEIERELKSYVEDFRLTLGEAKKLVARKHGASISISSEAADKALADLTPLDRNVNLLCRVVFAADRDITVDGAGKTIISGILGDDTGTAPFTLWEKGENVLRKGDVVRIEHAYVTEYKDQMQVNIGRRGKLTLADASEMPAFNGGPARQASPMKIIDLPEVQGNVSVTCRIITSEVREVTVGGETKRVLSGIMADDTGKVAYTCWGETNLKPGDAVKVHTGYLRHWRGMPQLNFDAGNVETVSDADMPDELELAKPVPVTIDRLLRAGGMVDAAIDGVILDIRQGSGLVFRCPECNRVLQNGVCRRHDEVEGMPDLRTKAVLDDGTGAITVIINRAITERLLGKSMETCMAEAKEEMNQGIIKDELFEKLVARPVRVSGNVTSDDFGLMMIATDTEFLRVDPEAEARHLLEAME